MKITKKTHQFPLFKEYPKQFQDLAQTKEYHNIFTVTSGILERHEHDDLMRKFLNDTSKTIFRIAITYFWLLHFYALEGTLLKDVNAHAKHRSSLYHHFAFQIGLMPKYILHSPAVAELPIYLNDFFPDFYKKNPFTEPEYYAYPYQYVTIDMLFLVFDVPWRLQMLQIAEERKYSFGTFYNWCANQLFSYNEEVGEEVFTIRKNIPFEAFINKYKEETL